jgi:hypothetical protein
MVERHPREIKRCLREGGRALVLMDYPSRGLCIPIASFSQRTIGASPSTVIAKPVSRPGAWHETECLEPLEARTSKCLGVNLANGNERTTLSIVTGSARPDHRRKGHYGLTGIISFLCPWHSTAQITPAITAAAKSKHPQHSVTGGGGGGAL